MDYRVRPRSRRGGRRRRPRAGRGGSTPIRRRGGGPSRRPRRRRGGRRGRTPGRGRYAGGSRPASRSAAVRADRPSGVVLDLTTQAGSISAKLTSGCTSSTVTGGRPRTNASTSRIFGTRWKAWMLSPTPSASRLAADASGWVVWATAARAGVGNTDDFRPVGSRSRASRSVSRGRSSGSPIGMSMATTWSVGCATSGLADQGRDVARHQHVVRRAAQERTDPPGPAPVHPQHRALLGRHPPHPRWAGTPSRAWRRLGAISAALFCRLGETRTRTRNVPSRRCREGTSADALSSGTNRSRSRPGPRPGSTRCCRTRSRRSRSR